MQRSTNPTMHIPFKLFLPTAKGATETHHGQPTGDDLKVMALLRALYILRKSRKERRHVTNFISTVPPRPNHPDWIRAVRSQITQPRLQHDLRSIRIGRLGFRKWNLNLNRNRRFSPRKSGFLWPNPAVYCTRRRGHGESPRLQGVRNGVWFWDLGLFEDYFGTLVEIYESTSLILLWGGGDVDVGSEGYVAAALVGNVVFSFWLGIMWWGAICLPTCRFTGKSDFFYAYCRRVESRRIRVSYFFFTFNWHK